MDRLQFFCAGGTAASEYAAKHLRTLGYSVSAQPSTEITGLILDVPSFRDDGSLRSGGSILELLCQLPENIRVFGGKLNHPALKNYRTTDLLLDPDYLAQNAYITAECALQIAAKQMTKTFRDCPVLIIGWGRIGKCLCQLLRGFDAEVSVCARNPENRAMLRALGCTALAPETLDTRLEHYRLIINTVPSVMLGADQIRRLQESCVLLDLASKPGISGDSVIWARGIPGIHAPESSGILIAETVIRLSKEV